MRLLRDIRNAHSSGHIIDKIYVNEVEFTPSKLGMAANSDPAKKTSTRRRLWPQLGK